MVPARHVVTIAPDPVQLHGSRLWVHGIPVGVDNLTWLVVDPQSRTALAIDGPEAAPVLGACDALCVDLTAVANTHTHGDHVGINRDLAKRSLLGGKRIIGPASVACDIPGLTEGVGEGSTFVFGDTTFTTWLTEGHLDGHVSFLAGDALFCGDTLFAGGCGYLFSGPAARMFESLRRFMGLPDTTRVFCGHEYTLDNLAFAMSVEPTNLLLVARLEQARTTRAAGRSTVPSTIGEEIATNPFLRWDSEALRANVAAEMPGKPMETALNVFAATRLLKDLKRYRR